MAHKRKHVGEIGTGGWIAIAAGVAVVAYFVFGQKPATTTTVVKTVPSTGGNSTTAAEIAAGSAIVTTALNDLTDEDD